MPKVSVNIPCYNGEKYIAEALQSVLDQTYQDFEVILVNDGSTDRTEEIVKGFCDERIKYYFQENIGLARTRNRQLELSSGEFIAFLDQDDLWLPVKLEKQIPLFEQNPNVGLVYSKMILFNDTGYIHHPSNKQKLHRGRIFGELLKGNFVPVLSAVLRKDVLDTLGEWFDERFNIVGDADLFLRIAHDYEINYVDEPLAKRRMHKESCSFKQKELRHRERKILINKLKELYPSINKDYSSELTLMESQISYDESLTCWMNGEKQKVRHHLQPFLKVDKKFLLPYVLSYLVSYRVYKVVLKMCGKYVYTP